MLAETVAAGSPLRPARGDRDHLPRCRPRQALPRGCHVRHRTAELPPLSPSWPRSAAPSQPRSAPSRPLPLAAQRRGGCSPRARCSRTRARLAHCTRRGKRSDKRDLFAIQAGRREHFARTPGAKVPVLASCCCAACCSFPLLPLASLASLACAHPLFRLFHLLRWLPCSICFAGCLLLWRLSACCSVCPPATSPLPAQNP